MKKLTRAPVVAVISASVSLSDLGNHGLRNSSCEMTERRTRASLPLLQLDKIVSEILFITDITQGIFVRQRIVITC